MNNEDPKVFRSVSDLQHTPGMLYRKYLNFTKVNVTIDSII